MHLFIFYYIWSSSYYCIDVYRVCIHRTLQVYDFHIYLSITFFTLSFCIRLLFLPVIIYITFIFMIFICYFSVYKTFSLFLLSDIKQLYIWRRCLYCTRTPFDIILCIHSAYTYFCSVIWYIKVKCNNAIINIK